MYPPVSLSGFGRKYTEFSTIFHKDMQKSDGVPNNGLSVTFQGRGSTRTYKTLILHLLKPVLL